MSTASTPSNHTAQACEMEAGIVWTFAEEAEGRRLAAKGLAAPEVYVVLLAARIAAQADEIERLRAALGRIEAVHVVEASSRVVGIAREALNAR